MQNQVQSPNGVIVYQNGVIGTTDLAAYYQQQNAINMASRAAAAIHPTKNGGGRNDRSRTNASRNSYLGYSAGKATYGRYYAKNNQDRSMDPVNAAAIAAAAAAAAAAGTSYDPSIVPQGALVNGAQSLLPLSAPDQQHLSTALYKAAGNPAALSAALSTNGGQPIYHTTAAATMQQIVPTTVLTAAQAQMKSSEQLLEEVCLRHMWGLPNYQLMTVPGADSRQLFFYKVTIPALASMYPQLPFFQVGSRRAVF